MCRSKLVYKLIGVICISCFLTFGITKSFVENKYILTIDDYFGTYSYNDGEELYISISVSNKGDIPENEGDFAIYNKSAQLVSAGECKITNDGIITILKDNDNFEEICFIRDKVYYCPSNSEPTEIKKVSDESM